MFEVGFSEIVLIFAIALLVLGPTRLPKLAADIGRWAGRARAMARQLRTQLEQEVQLADVMQDDKARSRPAQPVSDEPTIHRPVAPAATPPTPVADASHPTTAEPMTPASAERVAAAVEPAPAEAASAAPPPPATTDERKSTASVE